MNKLVSDKVLTVWFILHTFCVSVLLCALLAGLEWAELIWEKVMSCTTVHRSAIFESNQMTLGMFDHCQPDRTTPTHS